MAELPRLTESFRLTESSRPQADYPPPPWKLRGDLFGTVFRMPPDSIPLALLPQHLDLRRPDGTSLLATAWVDYQAGSALTYREFMVTGILRLRPPLHGTILRIWVDSPESQAGGRQLWHIPKDLAEFDFTQNSTLATKLTVKGTELASYTYLERGQLSIRFPFCVTVVQEHTAGIRRTYSSWSAHPAWGRGEFSIPDDSELSFLNRGRPLAHLALRDFRATFGLVGWPSKRAAARRVCGT